MITNVLHVRALCLLVAGLGVGIAPAHGQAPPTNDVVRPDLDDRASEWAVFTEGKPKYELAGASEPSLDGASLRCSIVGGEPFSNIHCYRNLPPDPAANAYHLALSFWFAPNTTCNNAGRVPSAIQAIEFSAGKWDRGRRYELALQWQNVGPGAPQWRYWDPSQPEKKRWVPLSPKLPQCLEGNRWHRFTLDGIIESGNVRYQRFSIDDHAYPLNLYVRSIATPGESDRLAVAFQLDGSARQAPFDVIVDQVHLLAQQALPSVAACENARLTMAADEALDRSARVSWSPSGCIMVLQAYQGGQMIREHLQALSGTVNLNDLPPGRTEVKIWVPGMDRPADAKPVDLQ